MDFGSFLFYYSYLGFLHFGWEDGIYLRYAGKRFDELDRKNICRAVLYILLQIVLAIVVSMFGEAFVENSDKRLALVCAIWLVPLLIFNNLCNFIMQILNRIKEYARLLVTERVIFAPTQASYFSW